VPTWYSINCTASGGHLAAVSTSDHITFTLNPDVNASPLEDCTVTIDQSQAVDRDGTPQAGSGNYQWSFHVAAGPTAVELRSLSAKRAKPGVLVSWRTGSEAQLLGFVLYRANGEKWVRVNRALIQAGNVGHRYELRDRAGLKGTRYGLLLVRLDGKRVWAATARAR
jgi:hypothetical protein